MREIDGIEAVEIIKKELDIPVIFFSSRPDDDHVTSVPKSDLYGFLIKPFTDSDMKTMIEIAIQQKKCERFNNESALLFHTIINHLADAIIGIDKDGYINFWNCGAIKLFNYKAIETLGKEFVSLFVPDSANIIIAALRQILRDRREKQLTISEEIKGLSKFHTEFHIELNFIACQSLSGIAVCCIARGV